jgi:hypothetical protein
MGQHTKENLLWKFDPRFLSLLPEELIAQVTLELDGFLEVVGMWRKHSGATLTKLPFFPKNSLPKSFPKLHLCSLGRRENNRVRRSQSPKRAQNQSQNWNPSIVIVLGSGNHLVSLNTRVTNQNHEQECTSHEEWGDKESPKACARLKSCESLYMCPRAPFYRETKGLLHFEITLESKEYSWCEHIQECLLHPVICGANSTHLEACH